MIRVSDGVEARLKAVGKGMSMSKTVEMLLDSPPEGITDLLEGQKVIAEKLGELRRLIEETTIDRVDGGSREREVVLTGDEVKDFWFSGPIDNANHPAWVSRAAYLGLSDSYDIEMGNWKVKGDVICLGEIPVFKLSEFLKWRER